MMIESAVTNDFQKKQSELDRLAGEAVKPGTDDSGWTDYVLAGGEAVKGARVFKVGDRAVLRHHLKLTKEQVDGLGVLRVGPQARNGRVFVNGNAVGEMEGWQSVGHEWFEGDVRRFLVTGDNVIAIDCSNYRQRGQLPLSVSLDPQEETFNDARHLRQIPSLRIERLKHGVFQRQGPPFIGLAFGGGLATRKRRRRLGMTS